MTRDRPRNRKVSRSVIFVRRVFSKQGVLTETQVEVRGAKLREVLEILLQDASDFAFGDDIGTVS